LRRPPSASVPQHLGGRAKASLLSLLFRRRFEVLKDFAEKKECRGPEANEDASRSARAFRGFIRGPCYPSPGPPRP
jgi:hypothetical protein